MTDAAQVSPLPRLNRLTNADVLAALGAGFADFRRAPAFGLFFGAIFSLTGIVIFLQLVVWQSSYWVLPIAAGFPLLGPFLAVGLYAVSRALSKGEPLDWASILSVPLREGRRQVPWMAFVAVFFYLVWVYLAHLIFALSFGLKPLTNVMSSHALFLTLEGITMLVVGSAVGGALAFLLFAVSVISIPMMLDREIDFVTAMVMSFRCVLENKGPMLLWGAIVAALSGVAMAPLFLGMLLVFPVLGHASWHLYTRAVARD
ncbi:MAG TPA: DUF2189 domain-containing protein [Thermohalobaculum sp.]|nr:DUF2189 domain-containing protein [Thermohalobaculum sp.]